MSEKPYPVLTQEMLVWSGGIVSLTQCKDLIRRYLKAISFVPRHDASLEDVVRNIHEEMTENEDFVRRCEAEEREEIRELIALKREKKQALQEKLYQVQVEFLCHPVSMPSNQKLQILRSHSLSMQRKKSS